MVFAQSGCGESVDVLDAGGWIRRVVQDAKGDFS
jgi:hypothetical protein